MRVLIVGASDAEIAEASRMAVERGAALRHVANRHQALQELQAGRGADLLLVDVRQDLAGLIQALAAQRILIPVVACGIGTDARTAVAAIKAGAREFLPLPPEPELIAAILEAVSTEAHELVFELRLLRAVARRGSSTWRARSRRPTPAS